MTFRLSAVFFCLLLLLPGTAMAVGEDLFHHSNAVGGAGWNIYDDFREVDEDNEAGRRAYEAEQKKLREEQQLKAQRRQDFFAVGVDVYDESISRSAREEKKLKGLRAK